MEFPATSVAVRDRPDCATIAHAPLQVTLAIPESESHLRQSGRRSSQRRRRLCFPRAPGVPVADIATVLRSRAYLNSGLRFSPILKSQSDTSFLNRAKIVGVARDKRPVEAHSNGGNAAIGQFENEALFSCCCPDRGGSGVIRTNRRNWIVLIKPGHHFP